MAGSVAMTMYSYRRFNANPTVVSIKKDFRNWNNPFPAATGCFLDRVHEGLAHDYVTKYIYNENYVEEIMLEKLQNIEN